MPRTSSTVSMKNRKFVYQVPRLRLWSSGRPNVAITSACRPPVANRECGTPGVSAVGLVSTNGGRARSADSSGSAECTSCCSSGCHVSSRGNDITPCAGGVYAVQPQYSRRPPCAAATAFCQVFTRAQSQRKSMHFVLHKQWGRTKYRRWHVF